MDPKKAIKMLKHSKVYLKIQVSMIQALYIYFLKYTHTHTHTHTQQPQTTHVSACLEALLFFFLQKINNLHLL